MEKENKNTKKTGKLGIFIGNTILLILTLGGCFIGYHALKLAFNCLKQAF